MDFEQAAWLAVREVFPMATIKCRVFHYTQAVRRKVQYLGLQTVYMERSSIHSYIRQLMTLPFLPSALIEPAFRELARRANSEKLADLITYIEMQLISHAVFDVKSWSVFGLTVRTNNDVEGWHLRLNRLAGHQFLRLYRLVPALRNEAELQSYELRLIRDDVSTRRVRPVYRAIERKVIELWERYSKSELNTSEILKSCAKTYDPQCEAAPAVEEEVLVTRL